ncbi:kinase-associated lipoprotein B [Metabacillus sp. 84]|uniref:kinase-associated lipoprotein B n=1 Tax=unclassified Metabacillus TaxID=2675274 RepID=UPI003CEBCBF8
MEWNVGDHVTGIYKTGKYAGVVTGLRPMHVLVQVKAVLKHPQQGDLHMPKQAEVPLFHERRALSFNEQTNIPASMLKSFDGEFPEYKDSLKKALEQQKASLSEEETLWAKKSLDQLAQLENEYKL